MQSVNNIEEYLNLQKDLGSSNIELTFRCKLQCSQCTRDLLFNGNQKEKTYMKEKLSKSSEIDLNDFKKLCNFFNNKIALCGQISDPIFHTKFFDILKICSNEFSNKTFKIHTAAHQKNLEWYKTAFDLTNDNITWIFGLDGLPETSHQYRKNQNSQLIYDAMMLGKEMGKNIVWQFIVFGFNYNQIEVARNICIEKKISFKLIFTDRNNGNVKLAPPNFQSSGPIKEWKS